VAPSVSVVLPTYNYGRYLRRAIDSVLAQTHRDLEVLVLDNGSTDETSEVLAQIRDPRVRSASNVENIGMFGNFNRCIELAQGDYVKFLCTDDWLEPRCIEDALRVVEQEPDIDVLTTPGWLVDDHGRVYGVKGTGFGRRRRVPRAEAIRAMAEHFNVVGMPSNVFARTDAVRAVGGFDDAFAPAADLHLWLKLLARSDLGYCPVPGASLRVHTTKSHTYGPDPTEAPFLAWRALAEDPGSGIDDETLAAALQASAEQSLYVVGALTATAQHERARTVMSFTRRHVPLGRATARMLTRLPRTLPPHVARAVALRRNRLLVYEPRPRVGAPLTPA